VERALDRCVLVDGALVRVLLGRELHAAVHRAFPAPAVVPEQRGATSLLAVWALMTSTVIIWGSGNGGCCGPRRRQRYYSDRYGRGYAVGSRRGFGPSCAEMLACNCCLNTVCNGCCCGDCGDV
jgi:hypothetical protein